MLPVLGKFTATLTREEKEIVDPVYVVKGQGDTALLSRGAAENGWVSCRNIEEYLYRLKDKFDEILDKGEEMDIIEDVRDEPTEWCSNVVLTPKKDGENIRARLDMTDANKYEGCPMLSTRFQSYPLFLDRKTGSADVQRPTNEGDLSDTNRFRWKSPCSIRGRLGKS